MLTAQQLEHYREEGYIIFNELFAADEMDTIRTSIDRFDEESERELSERQQGKDFIRIAKQINFTAGLNFRDPALQRFAADRRFAELSMDLLGPDVRLYWDQSVYKRPEANRDFPWHQDNGYAPIEPKHYVTCWLALEDSTIENGCVWIMPRSHQQGVVEHVKRETGWVCYEGEDPGIPVELKKGSMVAFSSMLFHRSTPNLSQTTRKAYVLQYSQVGSINPVTGLEYKNGPIVAKNGIPVYDGFKTKEEL